MEMVKGKKRIQSDEQPSTPSKRRVVRHQVDGRPIVLRECFIPLNPVRFSSSMLAAMDAVVPARLPSPDLPVVPQGTPVDATPTAVTTSLEPSPTTAVGKRRLAMCQVDATPTAVTRSLEPSSTTAVGEVVEEVVSRLDPPILSPSIFIKDKCDGNPQSMCAEKQQHSVFGRKWDVGIGLSVYGGFGLDESALLEKVQEHLKSYGMCLLNLHSAFSAIIQHNNYIVIVDCGTRDASGFASHIGRPVAVFNTSVFDLMYHISDLRRSLGAEWYAISSLSVKAGLVDPDIDSATLLIDVDVDVTVASAAVVEGGSSQSNVSSVRGSFHQGDNRRFQHAGAQCMAISLVALAKHSIDSVFSWQTDNLDTVVVLEDKLYNEITADSNVNSNQSKHLCVLDLPLKSVIDGQTFDFEYREYVSGDIDVVTGDMIDGGLTTSLRCGLIKMSVKPSTSKDQPSTSIKRKSQRSVSSSKKLKTSDYAEVNSDVVFVADVVSKGLQFKPLCGEVV
ncbi:hypothetical protein N1851_023517 [Merluccius polli]|uniref:Uncharacterized protein n=1 Tax=Merluccius polli TaxID=89951 RepID=A0AA47NWK6_MERPO|nr:hypothetical protein N1851_023517 [Merluccius polli]